MPTQKEEDKKDTALKRYKLLNETCSLSNTVLLELIINHMHCVCVRVIIIISLIIDISKCILFEECEGCSICITNKIGVPVLVYYENFR